PNKTPQKPVCFWGAFFLPWRKVNVSAVGRSSCADSTPPCSSHSDGSRGTRPEAPALPALETRHRRSQTAPNLICKVIFQNIVTELITLATFGPAQMTIETIGTHLRIAITGQE